MRQRKRVRGQAGKSFSVKRRAVWSKRQIPSQSRIWLDVGMLVLMVAFGAALGALTLSEGAPVGVWVPLTIFIASLVLSMTCFVAHWDSNRGRSAKRFEVTEEGEDES